MQGPGDDAAWMQGAGHDAAWMQGAAAVWPQSPGLGAPGALWVPTVSALAPLPPPPLPPPAVHTSETVVWYNNKKERIDRGLIATFYTV